MEAQSVPCSKLYGSLMWILFTDPGEKKKLCQMVWIYEFHVFSKCGRKHAAMWCLYSDILWFLVIILTKKLTLKLYQLLLKMQCLLFFGVRNPILNTRSNLYLWKTTMIIKRKLLCTKGHKESIIHYIKVMLPNTQHSCLSGRHRQHTAKWSLLKIPFFMSNSWD